MPPNHSAITVPGIITLMQRNRMYASLRLFDADPRSRMPGGASRLWVVVICAVVLAGIALPMLMSSDTADPVDSAASAEVAQFAAAEEAVTPAEAASGAVEVEAASGAVEVAPAGVAVAPPAVPTTSSQLPGKSPPKTLLPPPLSGMSVIEQLSASENEALHNTLTVPSPPLLSPLPLPPPPSSPSSPLLPPPSSPPPLLPPPSSLPPSLAKSPPKTLLPPPPSPRPPQAPPPPPSAADVLNEQFVAGLPAPNLREAGNLVHQRDAQQGQHLWEATWGRLAASVVNAHVPYMFSTSAVGLVIDPEAAQRADLVHCAYWKDGNSMNSGNYGCDGAQGWGSAGLQVALSAQERNARENSWCAWGAPTMEDRSGCRYNEVVLWGDRWNDALPQIVEAFFYPIHGHVDWREGDRRQAQAERDAFLARYRLDNFSRLLTFDVTAARRGEAPWAEDT